MSFAEECLERAVEKRLVRVAILKDDAAFERLYENLQTALTRSWNDQMREGIANALNRLRDLGSGKFTQEDQRSIMSTLEASVGEDALRSAMRDPVIKLTEAIFRSAADEVGQAANVDIAFNRPDLDALDVLKGGNLYWIGNGWNVEVQDKLAKILDEYFREGMTRESLTERMAEDFATVTSRSTVYWEMLADHTATKTREIGRVTGYDRAEIDVVKVRAQIDSVTSQICRAMHGRLITVDRLRSQRDAYLDATRRRDYDAAINSWRMHSDAGDLRDRATSDLPSDTAGPPYHFGCRTITVLYRQGRGGITGNTLQRITDREPLRESDITDARARAVDAAFLSNKRAREKFARHRPRIQSKKFKDYETDARRLINDAEDVFLSARIPLSKKGSGEPTLHAVFSKAQESRNDKEDGVLVTVVEMSENRIVSHHWRETVISSEDIVPAKTVESDE